MAGSQKKLRQSGRVNILSIRGNNRNIIAQLPVGWIDAEHRSKHTLPRILCHLGFYFRGAIFQSESTSNNILMYSNVPYQPKCITFYTASSVGIFFIAVQMTQIARKPVAIA